MSSSTIQSCSNVHYFVCLETAMSKTELFATLESMSESAPPSRLNGTKARGLREQPPVYDDRALSSQAPA